MQPRWKQRESPRLERCTCCHGARATVDSTFVSSFRLILILASLSSRVFQISFGTSCFVCVKLWSHGAGFRCFRPADSGERLLFHSTRCDEHWAQCKMSSFAKTPKMGGSATLVLCTKPKVQNLLCRAAGEGRLRRLTRPAG